MFSGVRFALLGFNPTDGNMLRSKLVSGGGVDVGQYSHTCTHLIVDKIVYDDPICVAARSNGKVVVTKSWVDHSFDVGMLIDANSVLYRPLKDLNGIPGCKSLVVCLTGYQRQDREDIMTMVGLMGGQFSKPLVANRVTHLICYKFEGEKYELAKRMKRIKLVNHRWLEDCLKNWKLLPEVDYNISGYELEIMEASARDSEDEAEDASAKRGNNSPLGIRVGDVAAVEMSKSGGKDVTQGGLSFSNTSKGHWLSPKKTDTPFEVMVSTIAGVPQQNTVQGTSSHASPIRVADKTPEKGLSRMETDGSTSINRSIRRHSSLATYSRKTPQNLPETNTLGRVSSNQNGSLRMDDKGLKVTAFNISASTPGSSMERTTLFEDIDKIEELHGKLSPPILPQAKLIEGSVCSEGSHRVHHNSEASVPPLASSLLQDSRRSSPKENLKPLSRITGPTENGEVGHNVPEIVLSTKLLSSNVVPVEYNISTAENIISDCAPNELPERSSTEPMAGNILLPEARSGMPKQNLKVAPNISIEVAQKLDVSDSAARLLNSGVASVEADIWTPENITMKASLDQVPERSVNEPVVRRSSTSPGSGLMGMKDKQETELPKNKTATRKSLGTRGRKKKPTNQKGSIYLMDPSLKDERTPVAENGNQKEISSPVLNTENVAETAKPIDSEIGALGGTDSANDKSYASNEKDHLESDLIMKQDNLKAKTTEEADAEVEITMVEPELNDVPTKEPSDDALQSEGDKNKSKRKREATVGGKKKSSSTTKVGKSSVKKMKKSRKEHDAKANDTVMKDACDNSTEEKENLALENKSGKVSFGGDQSPIAEEDNLQAKIPEKADAEVEITMVEPELNDVPTKDLSDGAVQSEGDKNKSKRKREATVGGKKESSTTKVGKSSVKKMKKSRKEHDAKANDTVMKDVRDNSTEEKENLALENKSGEVSSGGDQSPIAEETLARKDAVMKDSSNITQQLQVDRNKGKRKKEATVEKTRLQSGKEGSSTVEVQKSSDQKTKKSKKERGTKATNAVQKDIGDTSAEEKDNKSGKIGSGGDQSPVAGKSLTRKKVAKSANTGKKADKESKQLSTKKTLASKKVLQDQEHEPRFFIVSGPRSQRKEYQQIIKRLKGKCCRDSHQWSYQATHFIAPEMRRTEKFFAAAASGSWILKTDYVADSKEAGKLLPEEPYEWHSTGISADGSINLEAPRKWRLVREKTGHGALYGLRIVVYGDCAIPSLDTLKRVVKAGDGTIVATAPPYTRFLNQNTDFALISPGMPRDDIWIQEFMRHEIPCVLADYIVEYVCKPGYALDKHVLYNTNQWAERSFNKMQHNLDVCTE